MVTMVRSDWGVERNHQISLYSYDNAKYTLCDIADTDSVCSGSDYGLVDVVKNISCTAVS